MLCLPTNAGETETRPPSLIEGATGPIEAKPATSEAAMARAIPARMVRENISLLVGAEGPFVKVVLFPLAFDDRSWYPVYICHPGGTLLINN